MKEMLRRREFVFRVVIDAVFVSETFTIQFCAILI
jgi:hypothetical protein